MLLVIKKELFQLFFLGTHIVGKDDGVTRLHSKYEIYIFFIYMFLFYQWLRKLQKF